MLNKIYKTNGKRPLSHMKLDILWEKQGYNEGYDISRIQGQMCDCKNGGHFELLPSNHPAVIEGGKLYMVCRKCGCSSHL
jgi:hypothetical protein